MQSAAAAIKAAILVNGRERIESLLDFEEEPCCLLTVLCAGNKRIPLDLASMHVSLTRKNLADGCISLVEAARRLGFHTYDAGELEEITEILELATFG